MGMSLGRTMCSEVKFKRVVICSVTWEEGVAGCWCFTLRPGETSFPVLCSPGSGARPGAETGAESFVELHTPPHTQARRPQTGAQVAWRDCRDLWRARSRGQDVCDGGGGTQWQPVFSCLIITDH